MIIYGSRKRETETATGEFYCPRCQAQRAFKQKRVDRYFTLFFIPLFRVGQLGEYVECQTCFTTFKTEVLNLPGTAAVGPGGSALMPPAQLRPVNRNPSSLNWVLAILGGSMFLCGGLLGLLATVSQLTDKAGPTDNLEGFIGVMILCPLPLVVVGLGLLGSGLFSIWRNRQKAEADAINVQPTL